MLSREKVIEKCKKLRALATPKNGATNHERAVASEMLSNYIKKYNISENELRSKNSKSWDKIQQEKEERERQEGMRRSIELGRRAEERLKNSPIFPAKELQKIYRHAQAEIRKQVNSSSGSDLYNDWIKEAQEKCKKRDKYGY